MGKRRGARARTTRKKQNTPQQLGGVQGGKIAHKHNTHTKKTCRREHVLDRVGGLLGAPLLQQADRDVDGDHGKDEARLDPFLQASCDDARDEQHPDEHVVELRPELGEERRLLRRRERVGAIPVFGFLFAVEGGAAFVKWGCLGVAACGRGRRGGVAAWRRRVFWGE